MLTQLQLFSISKSLGRKFGQSQLVEQLEVFVVKSQAWISSLSYIRIYIKLLRKTTENNFQLQSEINFKSEICVVCHEMSYSDGGGIPLP